MSKSASGKYVLYYCLCLTTACALLLPLLLSTCMCFTTACVWLPPVLYYCLYYSTPVLSEGAHVEVSEREVDVVVDLLAVEASVSGLKLLVYEALSY